MAKSSVDKLLDWITAPPTQVITTTVNATEEMSIVPGDDPELKIEYKAEGRTLLLAQRNLAALDDYIGRLIKMRDALEKLKKAEP